MCLLSHLHSTSLFTCCSLFVICSAKLMMLYLFLMNFKRNVHFKSGLNKFKPHACVVFLGYDLI